MARKRRRRNPHVKPDALIKKIVQAALGRGWKGKEVEIEPTDKTFDLRTWWEGGYRDYHTFVRLPDLKAQSIPDQHPMFNKPIKGLEAYKMVPGVLVVTKRLRGSRKLTPLIRVHPMDINQLALVAPTVELDMIEALALLVTRMYISKGRYSEFRSWTRLSKADYDKARKALQQKGLLKKNNALTTEGRNVAGQWRDGYALLKAYGLDPIEYRKKLGGW